MADEVHSLLWKSALLSTESSYFPRLVEAAAWHHGKEYSSHMLRKVAATQEIVGALTVPIIEGKAEGIDAVLAQLANDPAAAAAMDQMILDAVEAYQPPSQQPGSQVQS